MLATARVIIIRGAIAVAELSGIKLQPRAPRETNADKIAISSIEKTPSTVLNNNPTISNMAISIAGVRLCPSFWLASAKASPIGTDPVI